jgi:hypothetical protein
VNNRLFPSAIVAESSHAKDSTSQPTNFASASIENTFAFTTLHSTSTALNLLSRAAGSVVYLPEATATHPIQYNAQGLLADECDLLQYHLVEIGVLTPLQVGDILER